MMNKREIFRKIGGIISELTEQYQYLSDNFENFNELELELFGANSHFLSEHIEILKKLNVTTHPNQNIAETAPIKTAENVFKVNVEPEPVAEPAEIKTPFPSDLFQSRDTEDKFDFEKKNLSELYDRQLTAEEQEIINRKKLNVEEAKIEEVKVVQEPVPTPPAIVETSQAVEHKEPATPTAEIVEQKPTVIEINPEVPSPKPTVVAETSAPVPTLNDIISAQANKNSVSAGLGRQPVADIKSIISLNDKLLFIKDLFNGYSLAYSEAIEILNRFDSLEAAENFLKTNYAAKNNWETKQSTVDKFFAVLERKYAK